MPWLSISSNRKQLGKNIVLVSLGGTFSDAQITSVMNRYPEARPFDCFDNDQAGRVYGLRMLSLLENIPMNINRRKTDCWLWKPKPLVALEADRPFRGTATGTIVFPLQGRAMAATQGFQGLERLSA